MKRGRELVPAVEAEVPADRLPERYRGVAEFAFGRLYGYIWVFAKGDRASVGAGIFRRERIDLRGILSAEMARRGINLDGIPIRAHPLPVYRKASPLHSLRTVLVGDAAGLVDPLQGEGIRHAVTSARIAASVIAAGRPLAEYTRKVQELIGRSHTRAGQLSWILYHFPGLAWRLALQSPRSVRVMTDLFNDKVDYPGLSRRLPSIALQALFGPITRTSRPQKEPG
jgi:flavin-dependent dehydrogenase